MATIPLQTRAPTRPVNAPVTPAAPAPSSVRSAQKPAQQLTANLTAITRTAVTLTRDALKRLDHPNAEQAYELLHQKYASGVAQAATIKAGQVFGPQGSRQLQVINQALAVAALQPAGRAANIEDLRDLARSRTQLLADLTDASTSPAQKAKIKEKLAATYRLAQVALHGAGREKASALSRLPTTITPYGEHSSTYREAGLTLAVTGASPQLKTIGDTLSHDMIGMGVGELPALGAGLVPAAIGIAGVLRGGRPPQPSGTSQSTAPQPGSTARPTSQTGTRADYEQARQQARADQYRYDPKKVTTDQLRQDVNPGLRTGETPQQAAARVQAANAELRARVPQIAQVDGLLASVRPHIVGNDFAARAERSTGGQINLQTGSAAKVAVPSANGVVVEPIPGSQGQPVGRFEFSNTPDGPRSGFLSGANSILPTSGGYTIKFMAETGKTPQNRPKYSEVAQWKTGAPLPEGYRLQLLSKQVKEKGFAGGHSSEAWAQTLKTYGDQISIDKAATKNIFYKTSADGKLDQASQYTYSFGGSKVKQPKTVSGSSAALKDLEPAISNQLARILSGNPNIIGSQIITVKIPVINRAGKTISMPIDVRVAKNPDSDKIEVRTWYIGNEAFKLGGLK